VAEEAGGKVMVIRVIGLGAEPMLLRRK